MRTRGGRLASFLFLLLTLFLPTEVFGFGAIACNNNPMGVRCSAAANFPTPQSAIEAAVKSCETSFGRTCPQVSPAFSNTCLAAAVCTNYKAVFAEGDTRDQANSSAAVLGARDTGLSCHIQHSDCDGTARENNLQTRQDTIVVQPPAMPPPKGNVGYLLHLMPTLSNLSALWTGLFFGVGLVIVLLVYAKRAAILNFIIHSRLPYKLPVYGEDIQCLFKRTQRINWYGRVVFRIIANLSMTESQLTDVRKYWLGRVIAFDSLRRQRQNELARMHLQLAASVKTEAKDKTALSQLWSVIKFFLLFFFYLLRAVFSFLFGFLFIRITVAKLVRGAVIESKDLVLILQAKSAIEETANYLKEYLATANTFDGRDEVV
jgi:hypothetical protein